MSNANNHAYDSHSNYPLHIASRDGVRHHLKDEVRLITQLPDEWPKVRGRAVAKKSYSVESKYSFVMDGATHQVEVVMFSEGGDVRGHLVDGKYFISQHALGSSMPIELMFASFKANKVRPKVRREWYPDYMGSSVDSYSLVTLNGQGAPTAEPYADVLGYDLHEIDCIADLVAQSYKFLWDNATGTFVATTDKHVITKRLRKPWMQLMVQMHYGENRTIVADHGKLLRFLVQKAAPSLSNEELDALKPFIDAPVGVSDLVSAAARQAELNELIRAYEDPFVLELGANVDEDPLFTIND